MIVLVAGMAWGEQKTVEEIIARVNGDIILKSELENAQNALRAELSQQQKLQGAQLEKTYTEQSKYLLRELIDSALLMQQAKELGLNADLEVVKTMEQMRQQYKFESLEALEKAIVDQGYSVEEYKENIRTRYLTSQVLNREVYPKIIITVEEQRKYYNAHLKDFDRPEGVHLSEILISTENKTPDQIEEQRKKAEAAKAALENGDSFADVAQKYSEAQTASSGGDLGFFTKGELTKPLEEVAWKLEKGQRSDIITVPYGFVILELEDKHNGGILPFEIAQKEITDKLFQDRVEGKVREYLTKLRMEGFVDVKQGYTDEGAPEKQPKISEVNPAKN